MSKKEQLTLEQKKQKQQKARSRQAILGAVALVAVIAIVVGGVLTLRLTGITMRGTRAASTTNLELTKAGMTYYFNEYLSDYVNERLYYINEGYLNLSLKTDLKDQTYDGENTWYSYFAGKAETNLREDMILCELAAKDGVALTDAEQKAIDARLTEMKPSHYGTGLNAEDVRICLERQALADKYLESVKPQLYGTAEEWDAQYKKNEKTYRTVDYLYVEIIPVIDSEAEQNIYDDLLEKALDSGDPQVFCDTALKILTDHADMTTEEAQTEVDGMLQSNQTYMEENPLSEWLFDEKTENYQCYIDETTSSCKLYMVTRLAGRDTSVTANYNSVYIPAAEGAEAEANALLDTWKAGEATVDSFAALLQEKYPTFDGHYENVFDGRMVDIVNEWLFADGRQAGDAAVLNAGDGFYVLCYEGEGIQRWQIKVRGDMYQERYDKLMEDGKETYQFKLNESVLNNISDKIHYEDQ